MPGLSVVPEKADWFTPAWQRGLRITRWALYLGLAGYVVSTVPGVRSGTGYNVPIDGVLCNGITFVAALLCFLRAAKVRRDRLAWTMIGTSIALYTIGNVVYFAYVQFLDPVPYPSIADYLWIAFYAFPYVGLVLLVRRRVRVFHASIWLDGIVAALGTASFVTLALPVILRSTGGSTAEVATTMAYPLGDLTLLVLVVGICGLLGWRAGWVWALLGLGLALYAAADTIYMLRVATGTFHPGTMLDPLWAIGEVLMAVAALRRPGDGESIRLEGWSVMVVPTLFTVAAMGLVVYGNIGDVPGFSTLLATGTVLAGLGRAGMTFREVQSLAEARREALTDDLTGLGNRRALYRALELLADRSVDGDQVAVLLIDLDRFKEVNDALGHHVGDRLLIEVAQRLQAHVRQEDLLVRLGGDEFAVLTLLGSETEALRLAERLRQALQQTFTVDGFVVHLDASIGVAVEQGPRHETRDLLQRADIAMYKAKVDRTGCEVYEGSQDDLRERIQLVEELRHAIDNDELVLHFQPKVALSTGRLHGVEALVRWQHPTRGLLQPGAFIDQAERAGFMRRLTTAVLALALDQAKDWANQGHRIPVSVNISPSSLLDVSLPDQITDMLVGRALPPSALVVEITEGTLVVDRTRSLEVLRRLRERGILIAVDDYGTGYSSLAYLRDLPVDELKLDYSFVSEMERDPRIAAIVESTVGLAHSLGLPLVAEGIETEETLRRLTRFGCDLGQGFFLGRPVPAADLEEWIVGPAIPAPRAEAASDVPAAT